MPATVRPVSGGFTLNSYDAIGFDLDHTIARYRLGALYRLCYSYIVKHLIENGYPQDVFRPFEDAQLKFCQKGLVYDLERGNVLKLGSHREIIKAFHGTRCLSELEINQVYDATCATVQRLKSMPFIRGETPEDITEKLYCFGDYFTVATIYLLMEIVDAIDDGRIVKHDYGKPFRDMFAGYAQMYRREAFREHSGYFFPEIKEKPGALLYPLTSQALEWLRSLRKDGMKVILITSSNVDFAEALLHFCIGKNFMEYFDSVITFARKPGFWIQQDRAFYTIKENHTEGDQIYKLKNKTIYAQGCYAKLSDFLKSLCEKNDPRFIYVGDSLADDMFVPSKFGCCDTIGIVEELELKSRQADDQWGSFLGCLLDKKDTSLKAAGEAEELTSKSADQPAHAVYSTLWAEVVSQSCKLIVPSVEILSRYPRYHVYTAPNDDYLVFHS